MVLNDCTTFSSWDQVPNEFEGKAYLTFHKCFIYVKYNRVRHRLDGPALEYDDGAPSIFRGMRFYFIDNKQLDVREFFIRTSKLGRVLYGSE